MVSARPAIYYNAKKLNLIQFNLGAELAASRESAAPAKDSPRRTLVRLGREPAHEDLARLGLLLLGDAPLDVDLRRRGEGWL